LITWQYFSGISVRVFGLVLGFYLGGFQRGRMKNRLKISGDGRHLDILWDIPDIQQLQR
jgi:hypothetical protein